MKPYKSEILLDMFRLIISIITFFTDTSKSRKRNHGDSAMDTNSRDDEIKEKDNEIRRLKEELEKTKQELENTKQERDEQKKKKIEYKVISIYKYTVQFH